MSLTKREQLLKLRQKKREEQYQLNRVDLVARLRASRRSHKTVMPILDDVIKKANTKGSNVQVQVPNIAGTLTIPSTIKASNKEIHLAVECYQKMLGNSELSAYQVQDVRSNAEKLRMYRNPNFQQRERRICAPLYKYLDMVDPSVLMHRLQTPAESKSDFKLATYFVRDRLKCDEQHALMHELSKASQPQWEELNELAESVHTFCPYPSENKIPVFRPMKRYSSKSQQTDPRKDPFLGGEYAWEEVVSNIFQGSEEFE